MTLSNLPPGVHTWNLPGCTREDEDWERALDQVLAEAEDDGEHLTEDEAHERAAQLVERWQEWPEYAADQEYDAREDMRHEDERHG